MHDFGIDDHILDELAADIARREWEKLRIGDDDHPINVANIKRGLKCIDDLCEVEILQPIFDYDPYRFLHVIPAHERVFAIYDRWGVVKRKVRQEYRQDLTLEYAVDPYMFQDRDRETMTQMARMIIERFKYQLIDAWPHHP